MYYTSDVSNSFSKRFRVYDDRRTRGGIAPGGRRGAATRMDGISTGARRPSSGNGGKPRREISLIDMIITMIIT